MIELAFLRVYLAWEVFLQESFVLYLLGQKAPRGRAPRRFTFPPTRRYAVEWVKESREFVNWDADSVRRRAQRFFRNGHPFTAILQSKQNGLGDAKSIRNAMVHESDKARDGFEKLVRQKLKTLPPKLSVGRFLNTPIPRSAPPQSFLEFYFETIESVAERIVPS